MKFLPNLEETGYADWYGWCRANWGTKWNACDPEVIDDNIIEFYTAWAPPLPIFFALAKKYQDAEFIVEINDECDPYVVTMRFAYDKKTNTVKDEFLGRERAYDDDDIEDNAISPTKKTTEGTKLRLEFKIVKAGTYGLYHRYTGAVNFCKIK